MREDIPEDLAVRIIRGGDDVVEAMKEVVAFCIKNNDPWMACIIQNEVIQRLS